MCRRPRTSPDRPLTTPTSSAPITLHTPLGVVRGVVTDGVACFRGIRYGEPPVGRRRFRMPAPVGPWAGVLDATNFGPASIQPRHPAIRLDGETSED